MQNESLDTVEKFKAMADEIEVRNKGKNVAIPRTEQVVGWTGPEDRGRDALGIRHYYDKTTGKEIGREY